MFFLLITLTMSLYAHEDLFLTLPKQLPKFFENSNRCIQPIDCSSESLKVYFEENQLVMSKLTSMYFLGGPFSLEVRKEIDEKRPGINLEVKDVKLKGSVDLEVYKNVELKDLKGKTTVSLGEGYSGMAAYLYLIHGIEIKSLDYSYNENYSTDIKLSDNEWYVMPNEIYNCYKHKMKFADAFELEKALDKSSVDYLFSFEMLCSLDNDSENLQTIFEGSFRALKKHGQARFFVVHKIDNKNIQEALLHMKNKYGEHFEFGFATSEIEEKGIKIPNMRYIYFQKK